MSSANQPPSATSRPSESAAGSASTPQRRSPRRARAGWVLFAVAVVVGGVLGWWWRNREPELSEASPPPDSPPPVVEVEQQDAHPLDPALDLARDGLRQIQAEVDDYTATITKRERIAGELVEQKMLLKLRERKYDGDELKVPMAVYLKFLEPSSVAGREVIWVEGRNEGKLVAHEGGFKNLLRVNLAPKSMLAMLGNRYPITEIGMQNLITKLVERGEQDRETGNCEVEFLENQQLGDRTCRVIQITHPKKEPRYDFYRASIYIDTEHNIPLRYQALVWPEEEGGEPVLDEEYIYEDVQLNVGLTDKDFDPDNEEYQFP